MKWLLYNINCTSSPSSLSSSLSLLSSTGQTHLNRVYRFPIYSWNINRFSSSIINVNKLFEMKNRHLPRRLLSINRTHNVCAWCARRYDRIECCLCNWSGKQTTRRYTPNCYENCSARKIVMVCNNCAAIHQFHAENRLSHAKQPIDVCLEPTERKMLAMLLKSSVTMIVVWLHCLDQTACAFCVCEHDIVIWNHTSLGCHFLSINNQPLTVWYRNKSFCDGIDGNDFYGSKPAGQHSNR